MPFPIPLGEKIAFATQGETGLSRDGQVAIRNTVNDWARIETERRRVEAVKIRAYHNAVYGLPTDWDFAWVSNNDKYGCKGKLPQRISKYFYEEYKAKMPAETLAEIGKLAKQYEQTPDPRQYLFDVVDRFQWKAGDFGDGGACFMTYHWFAKEIIRFYGGLAVRFYDVKNPNRGIARAWVLPGDGDVWYVANGHGKLDGGGGLYSYCTTEIGTVLAAYLKRCYRMVSVYIRGECSAESDCYLSSSGVALYGEANVENVKSSMEWRWQVRSSCVVCGKEVGKRECDESEFKEAVCLNCLKVKRAEEAEKAEAKAKADAEVYAKRVVGTCERCGDGVYGNEILHNMPKGKRYCNTCFNARGAYCHDCGHVHYRKNMHRLYVAGNAEADDHFCTRCARKRQIPSAMKV